MCDDPLLHHTTHHTDRPFGHSRTSIVVRSGQGVVRSWVLVGSKTGASANVGGEGGEGVEDFALTFGSMAAASMETSMEEHLFCVGTSQQ